MKCRQMELTLCAFLQLLDSWRFLLANKYENPELREKSFAEIKKIFPNKQFNDDLKTQPEKLKKIFELQKKYNQEIAAALNEF